MAGETGMDVYTWVVPLVLLFPLLWVVRVTLVARAIAGMRFGRDAVEVIDHEALPPHVYEALAPRLEELEAQGFVGRQAWRFRSGSGVDFDMIGVEAEHAADGTRAVIRPRDMPDEAGEAWIALRTLLADGRELVTRDYADPALMPLAPGVEQESLERARLEDLLARHRERVSGAVAAGATVRRLDAPAAREREQATQEETLELARGSGDAVTDADGRLRWKMSAAWRVAMRILKEETARKKAGKKNLPRREPTPVSAEARTEFELESYRRTGALQRGRLSGGAKTALMLVSLVAFALALGWQMKPREAVFLILALIVHEAGHLLGMWIFGHKDTQLLFIPFLGGAAVSHDQRVLKPWQHLVILFLGPLPGLFAGLCLMVVAEDHASWMWEAGLMAVALNAFNLLPIMPLDGGQVVDTAFVTRFPALRTIFVGVSGACLVAIAVGLDGGTLLLVLGVFMLLRLPVEWRAAKLIRQLRREMPTEASEETVVRALLARMRDGGWKAVKAVQRTALARAYQETVRRPRPRIGTMILAAAAYASPVWLGLPLMWMALVVKTAREMNGAEAREIAAGLHAPTIREGTKIAVAEEDNAALPLLKAVELIRKEDGATVALAAERGAPEMVALVREAAKRPAAAWPTVDSAKRAKQRGAFMVMMTQVAGEASNLVKFRSADEALVLAVDGLLAERHLRMAPEWTWGEHSAVQNQLWAVVEEAMAAGAKVTNAVQGALEKAGNEEEMLAFARVALVAQQVETLRLLRSVTSELGEGLEGVEVPASARVLELFAMMDPSRAKTHAEFLEGTVRLQAHLRALRGEVWPPMASKPRTEDAAEEERAPSADMSGFQLAMLAQNVARVRQAKVAMGLAARDTAEAEGRGAATSHVRMPKHPLTGEELKRRREGAMEVLVFAAPKENPLARELVWRLPVRK